MSTLTLKKKKAVEVNKPAEKANPVNKEKDHLKRLSKVRAIRTRKFIQSSNWLKTFPLFQESTLPPMSIGILEDLIMLKPKEISTSTLKKTLSIFADKNYRNRLEIGSDRFNLFMKKKGKVDKLHPLTNKDQGSKV